MPIPVVGTRPLSLRVKPDWVRSGPTGPNAPAGSVDARWVLGIIISEPITTSDPDKPLITAGFQYKAPAASTPTAVEAPAIERCMAPDPGVMSPCPHAAGDPKSAVNMPATRKTQRLSMAHLQQGQRGQERGNACEPGICTAPSDGSGCG